MSKTGPFVEKWTPTEAIYKKRNPLALDHREGAEAKVPVLFAGLRQLEA